MNTKQIGAISKDFRESLGLSVAQVSEKMGKHRSSVYLFENGEHKDPKGYILSYAILDNSDDYLNKVLPLMKEEV